MFGNLGMGELMVILVIVLVLFGAKRIPEISASFGKGIREFKKNVNDVERSITEPEPRVEPRLPAGEPVIRRDVAADEVRPEPKRLI
ncbi:MAG: twin-arginine translocase TatA/TatE family subunit [bacterium]